MLRHLSSDKKSLQEDSVRLADKNTGKKKLRRVSISSVSRRTPDGKQQAVIAFDHAAMQKKTLSIDLLFWPKDNEVLKVASPGNTKPYRTDIDNSSDLRFGSKKSISDNAVLMTEVEYIDTKVERGFLRYDDIRRSLEYQSIKKKLDDSIKSNSVMEIYQRELMFNRKSIDSYKKHLKNKSEIALGFIVKEIEREAPLSKKVVVVKREGFASTSKDIEEEVQKKLSKEAAEYAKSHLSREALLMWHPRKEISNGILESKEGRAICHEDSKAYIWGGPTSSATESDKIICYDSQTNELSDIEVTDSHVPLQRSYHSMVYYDDALYIFGGELIKRGRNMPAYYFDDLWKFSLATKSFSQVKCVGRAEGRIRHAICLFGNGHLVVSGGISENDQVYSDMFVVTLNSSAG